MVARLIMVVMLASTVTVAVVITSIAKWLW